MEIKPKINNTDCILKNGFVTLDAYTYLTLAAAISEPHYTALAQCTAAVYSFMVTLAFVRISVWNEKAYQVQQIYHILKTITFQ